MFEGSDSPHPCQHFLFSVDGNNDDICHSSGCKELYVCWVQLWLIGFSLPVASVVDVTVTLL